ncbi:MAG: SH3 domain-containing protein [Candidatus Riflebacteria bacterium]|nr:SH3 domain-containing protein [Candidatus Riflebacteria bacterium]
MSKNGVLLTILLIMAVLAVSDIAEARRGIVVPTPYGYSLISGDQSPILPAWGFSGMHPVMPAPTASLALMPAPVWNGAFWSHQTPWAQSFGRYSYNGYALAVAADNLNVRSEPRITGKKRRNANVIASLNAGEHLYVLGRSGNWCLVQSASMPLRRGYVYERYLRFYQNYSAANQYASSYPVVNRPW